MVSFFFTVQDICLEVITELPSSAISVPTQKLLMLVFLKGNKKSLLEIKFLSSVADGWVKLTGSSSSRRAIKLINNSSANDISAEETAQRSYWQDKHSLSLNVTNLQ